VGRFFHFPMYADGNGLFKAGSVKCL
jgi:hypothetical protein